MDDQHRWILEELNVPYIDYSINSKDPNIQPLLDVVSPGLQADIYQCKRMTDGITNVVLKFQTDRCLNGVTGISQKFLIRIYGAATEFFIDRKRELRNHKRLHIIGRAEPIFAVLQNGYVYGFAPGRTATLCDFTSRSISIHIATSLGDFHRSIPVDESEVPGLFDQIRDWLDKVPKNYSNPDYMKMFKEKVDLPAIRIAIDHYERIVQKQKPDLSFCHNDLLCHNVIVSEDQGGTVVKFIDYEYGGLNYCAYDIANHFNEFAGLEIESIDYSRYPSIDFQKQWIEAYLKARDSVTEPKQNCVHELLQQIAVFANVSHIYWGVWALVQAHVSKLNFDYMTYAILRLQQASEVRDGQGK
eukprot:gene1514-4665_t